MKRCPWSVAILLFLFSAASWSQELPSSRELLERSMRYHDPKAIWMTGTHRIELQETRPDGTKRDTRILLDNRAGRFELERVMNDGALVRMEVSESGSEVSLNGATEMTEEEMTRYRIAPDRAESTRNYYAYLYGLPMKLEDPGTRLAPEAEKGRFQGKDVLVLRVTYDESVGTDTWYFYFDPTSYALVGYRFYHDEAKGDGEYITLEEEATGGEDLVRLPRIRKWYRNADDGYLGTDTILSLTSGAP